MTTGNAAYSSVEATRYYTVPEVAKLLKYAPTYIRKLIKMGTIESTKPFVTKDRGDSSRRRRVSVPPANPAPVQPRQLSQREEMERVGAQSTARASLRTGVDY